MTLYKNYEVDTLFNLMCPGIKKLEAKSKPKQKSEYEYTVKKFTSGRFNIEDLLITKTPIDTRTLKYINQDEKPFSKVVYTKGRFTVYEEL